MSRPLDAASLLIYRKKGNDTEMLMGQRRSKARFAPGMFVFPGGIHERADAKIGARIDGVKSSLQQNLNGLACTAIRETFEETGLMLGTSGELGTSENESWQSIAGMRLVPALQHLHYLGRAITPTVSKHRYHARFFVTEEKHLSGKLEENGELLNLDWHPLACAIQLPMFDVTEFMLEEFGRFLEGEGKGYPRWSHRAGKAVVKYE